MDLPSIINIIISLTFIYLLLSLLTLEIQEAIATFRQWRAKHLKNSIAKILQNENLTRKIYDHALIKTLKQTSKNRYLIFPYYIPSDIFAYVLLDVLNLDFKDLQSSKNIEEKIERSEPMPPDLKAILSTFAKTDLIQTQPPDRVVQELHRQIANWFDETMERASGAYKRNAKGVSFLLGLLVAVVGNVDTIYLSQRLYKDEILRSSVAQISEEILARNSEAIAKCLNTAKTEETKSNCLQSFKNNLHIAFDDLASPLIGWHLGDPSKQLLQQQTISSTPKWNLLGIFKVIFGWLLTAIAISMGAPFWFEMLNKFVNVRNAGRKPNSSAK